MAYRASLGESSHQKFLHILLVRTEVFQELRDADPEPVSPLKTKWIKLACMYEWMDVRMNVWMHRCMCKSNACKYGWTE